MLLKSASRSIRRAGYSKHSPARGPFRERKFPHGRESMKRFVIACCLSTGAHCSCASPHAAPAAPSRGSDSSSIQPIQSPHSEASARASQRHVVAALRSGPVDESSRPLVEVDLPDGPVRTLCGSAAAQAESDALTVFRDPGRSWPSCQQVHPGIDLSPFICITSDRTQRVLTIVEVVNAEKPYITSIVNSTVGMLGYAQRLSELRRQERSAHCD